MSTESGIETTDLTEIVGEMDIPCDYDRLFHCGPAGAGWLMVARCGCGQLDHRLVCDGCKNAIVQTEDGLRCPSCTELYIPARKAFARIEPL